MALMAIMLRHKIDLKRGELVKVKPEYHKNGIIYGKIV